MDALDLFQRKLKQGMGIDEFFHDYEEVWSFIYGDVDRLKAFRPETSLYKKFLDEVTPCKRLLKAKRGRFQKISSCLDSSYPDFILFDTNGSEVSVEVTVTQGAERSVIRETMKIASEGAEGEVRVNLRNFLGFADQNTGNAQKKIRRKCEEAIKSDKCDEMNSTEEIVQCAVESLENRVRDKNNAVLPRNTKNILLIEHFLLPMPLSFWENSKSLLESAVQKSVYNEVYLTGLYHEDVCLLLKGAGDGSGCWTD